MLYVTVFIMLHGRLATV